MAHATTDNFRKHTSTNPLQKLFIQNFYRVLLSLAGSIQAEKILDVGCGEGFTLMNLSSKKIGSHLEGIDSSKTAIELGKKMNSSLLLKHGSIYELPYKSKSFDLVICTEVLEHLEEPEKALDEMIRVSKKYLLLSVPNEPIFRGANFLRGKNLRRFGNDIEHIQHWSTFGFQKLTRDHGLTILAKRHPFPWTMLLCQKG